MRAGGLPGATSAYSPEGLWTKTPGVRLHRAPWLQGDAEEVFLGTQRARGDRTLQFTPRDRSQGLHVARVHGVSRASFRPVLLTRPRVLASDP